MGMEMLQRDLVVIDDHNRQTRGRMEDSDSDGASLKAPSVKAGWLQSCKRGLGWKNLGAA